MNSHEFGQDYERDCVELAAELRECRHEQEKKFQRILDLGGALCDMLFVYTCFDQYCQDVPPDLKRSLAQMAGKARDVYVGRRDVV